MLRSIRLRNFRSLRDTGEVELRPIVLLVGANSSGKSSFLRFFPLLKQTAWSTNSSSPLLWYLDNSDVDFGDYSNAVYRGQVDVAWIEVSGEVADEFDPVRFTSRIAGSPDARSHIQRFTVAYLDDTIELEAGEDGKLRELLLNGNPIAGIEGQLAPRAGPIVRLESDNTGNVANERLFDMLRLRLDDRFDDRRVNYIVEGINHGSDGQVRASLQRLRGGDVWRSVVASLVNDDDLIQKLKELVFLRGITLMLERLGATVREYALGVRYIGPFRRAPERFYRRSELGIHEIDRDGSNLAMFLDSLNASDRDSFSAWLRQHFSFGVHTERREAHVSVMVDTDSRRSFNVMDMGFGMSQLLPVVAQCWLASGQLRSGQISLFRDATRSILPGKAPTLIAVEQPELHLHPHHQSQLADMFHSTVHAMDQIGQPICLCVETHSEAMLYRFGELVESGSLKREDISILLFEKRPGTDESTVRPIEFDANGVLQDWPIGFFRG